MGDRDVLFEVCSMKTGDYVTVSGSPAGSVRAMILDICTLQTPAPIRVAYILLFEPPPRLCFFAFEKTSESGETKWFDMNGHELSIEPEPE